VLLAVSDGMGGAEAGEVASSLVVESLREHLVRPGDPTPTAVSSAVQKANRDVWVAARVSGVKEMGATLASVLVTGTQAHIASVGDSRAYILRENRIRQITKDQSYIAALVDAGYAEEDLKNSPFRNVILQAMGTKPDVVVALGRIALRRGDVFLICSDGLSDMVEDEEILELVHSNRDDLDKAVKALVSAANRGGGEDNITAVAFEISAAAAPNLEDTVAMPALTGDENEPDEQTREYAEHDPPEADPEPDPGGDTMVVPPGDLEPGASDNASQAGAGSAVGNPKRVRIVLIAVFVLAIAAALVIWGLSR
jgi:serine/threonine protein phosphatase PrpC